jgi:hypothetical protein
MEGVILFADDKIHKYGFNPEDKSYEQSDENKLFKNLAQSFSVLGVQDLKMAENTIKAVGVFSALILDWQFEKDELPSDDETDKLVQAPSVKDDATFNFLMSNEIFSLIYIYSTAAEEIKEKHLVKLEKKYTGRIQIHDKKNITDTAKESQRIIADLKAWKSKNTSLEIPFKWSKSVNQSMQKIFSNLQAADSNWISELYNTSASDGVDPGVEVINMFQNILSESITQDNTLLSEIKEVAAAGIGLSNPEHYSTLMRILYFGQSKASDPFMTGDIFKYPGTDKYCIIITPECDIRHVLKDTDKKHWEVLTFSKDDYKRGNFKLKATIKPTPVINKAEEFKTGAFTKNEKIEIAQELNKQVKEAERKLQIESFTQTEPRIHLIPCFEFEPNNLSGIALIDFRTSLALELGSDLKAANRIGRLNPPFIQELRQRYFSYKGRVGVPGYSMKLREWLLSKQK